MSHSDIDWQARFEEREQADRRLIVASLMMNGLFSQPTTNGAWNLKLAAKTAVNAADILLAELAKTEAANGAH